MYRQVALMVGFIDSFLGREDFMRKMIKAALSATLLIMASTGVQASYCSDGKTVTFAGIPWESGDFITRVIETILAKGYDCRTDTIPGNSVTLEQGVAQNDIQIFAEEWVGRSEVWIKAATDGKVVNIGAPITGASEGWYVPAYLIKGDEARAIEPKAPSLRAVEQLGQPEIVALFRDPEEPTKGRFLNCPFGWTCEGESTVKLADYGLEELYVNFRPGSGAALDSAILSAYLQGQPILFYYWSPTAIMGKLDLIELEAPAFNDACRTQIASGGSNREGVCAASNLQIAYGVNAEFSKQAPDIIDILEKATFPIEEINKTLAYMGDEGADAAAAATRFLQERGDIWHGWVNEEARAKIEASL